MSKTTNKFSPEVREGAVGIGLDGEDQYGLAREKWRAPTEPGGVLWEMGTDRRRSFGVKRCGWR